VTRLSRLFEEPLARALVLLAAVRVAIPLVALAGSGHDLPLLPAYTYRPLNGDSFGFYAAARELISAAGRVHPVVALLVVIAFGLAVVAATKLWRRGADGRWQALLAVGAALSLAATVVILEMAESGSAVIGWSLVWAVPMFPLRVAGLGPGPDLAFAVALTLSLACNAATTVATGLLALRVTGSRRVAMGAAGIWAVWPLLAAPLAGRSAWENGQWNVDVGLHLYTEPLSTMLVTSALVLVLGRRPGRLALTGAGLLFGLATAVKLTNGLLGLLVVAVLVLSQPVGAALVALGGIVSVPVIAAYWPKGYVGMFGGQIAASDDPFALSYFTRAWTDSLLFTTRLLAILVPLLLLGLVAVRGRARLVLGLGIAVTALFYSFYEPTYVHPRFLYVVLPAAFVLVAAGLALLGKEIVWKSVSGLGDR
jgi:hypothetical protein